MKDSKLQPITVALLGDRAKSSNFKDAADFYKQFIKQQNDNAASVTIAQVSTGGSTGSGSTLHPSEIRYYKMAEWKALTQAKRDAILAARPARKKRGRGSFNSNNKNSGGNSKRPFKKFKQMETQIAALTKQLEEATGGNKDEQPQSSAKTVTFSNSNRTNPALQRNKPQGTP